MVRIGDKYKERLPLKGKYFDWTLQVVGVKNESYGEFADCVRTYTDGKVEKVSISTELLDGDIFYKKLCN